MSADPPPFKPFKVEITEADIEAARAVGATGSKWQSSPDPPSWTGWASREGRTVKVTRETITIDLPPGYDLPS